MANKNYINWTKEELVTEIASLKKRKKFGLVWEEKREDAAERCKEEIPVLAEVQNLEIISSNKDPINLIIEGDNYHSLSVLNYTHKGKIDLIYIDPPYNTGARNWKYDNDYVDKEDSYRHSKWLSLMNKRLNLSKKLLAPDGVLICAIDENEHSHLFCLLEEIFSKHEIHSISIIHNPGGKQGDNFSYSHDFAIFVIPKDKKIVLPRKLHDYEIKPSPLRKWGGISDRKDGKTTFFPIVVKKNNAGFF